jgi:type III secretion system low calcium response chaperone LcrH/SycD
MTESVTIGDIELSGLDPEQKGVLEALKAGATFADLRGLTEQEIEAAYATGYNLYHQAKFAEAEPLMQFACLYGPTEGRYWNGLGGCRQMLKNYQGAIDAYGMAYFFLASRDPWPAINTAVCSLALADKQRARDALALAEKAIDSTKPDVSAQQRIAALRQGL